MNAWLIDWVYQRILNMLCNPTLHMMCYSMSYHTTLRDVVSYCSVDITIIIIFFVTVIIVILFAANAVYFYIIWCHLMLRHVMLYFVI